MLSNQKIKFEFSKLLKLAKYSTATDRENRYKNIAAAQNDDGNPDGWDTAKPFETMPGPKAVPFIGNMWRFFPGARLHNITLDKMLLLFQKQYGDIVHLGGLWGRRDKVFLYNADDIENILRNSGPYPYRLIFDAFYYYKSELRKDKFKGNLGLVLLQGEEWYKMRTIMNQILIKPQMVQKYTTKMDSVAKDFVKYISYRMKSEGTNQTGEDFNIDLYKWALDSVCLIALNRKIGALDLSTEKNSEMEILLNSVVKMLDQIYWIELLPHYWKYFPSKKLNEFIENLDLINSMVARYIDETLPTLEDGKDLPDDELCVLQRLAKINKEMAYIMTLDMIQGGVDTIGKTLGAALYFLAKNPDKQNILREEILKYLPEKETVLTPERLSEMQYLKATLKESNRIAPVTLSGLRTTIKNMVIGGYQIPKNTDVIPVYFYASSVVDKYFKDPSKFMPERWLRSVSSEYSAKNAHQFAYMPFGYGPRSCVGKRFATLEIEVAIANIIRNFELSWEYPDMKFESLLLYTFKDPLKLTLKEVNR